MYRTHLRTLAALILLVGSIGAFVSTTSASRTTPPPARLSQSNASGADLDAQFPLFWFAPRLPTRYVPTRISKVAFDPTNPKVALASVGNGDDYILRSTNGGATWSALPNWKPSVVSMLFRVTSGGRQGVFYAWGGIQLYKTSNNGDSWQLLPYPKDCNQIVTLTVHPLQPDTLYAGTTSGFAKSFDGGQTWNWDTGNWDVCEHGPTAMTIDVGIDQPNIVYAGLFFNYSGGVWRSDDAGATWLEVKNGLPKIVPGTYTESIIKVVVDPRNANVVYALTEHGAVYKTSTGGGLWEPLTAGIETGPIRALALDPQTYVLHGMSDSQLYDLEDGATSWQMRKSYSAPQTASAAQSFGITLDPGDPERVIIYNDNGLYVGLPERGRVALPMMRRVTVR